MLAAMTRVMTRSMITGVTVKMDTAMDGTTAMMESIIMVVIIIITITIITTITVVTYLTLLHRALSRTKVPRCNGSTRHARTAHQQEFISTILCYSSPQTSKLLFFFIPMEIYQFY
ncbi:hypothetical protein BDB00DRAFT_933217, partial [Zychaea mexicana]|uniref:uncharacterized protein n=1 Tax=Zychaea mexicana TaxID=64656 RepID=UPI0022FEDEC5